MDAIAGLSAGELADELRGVALRLGLSDDVLSMVVGEIERSPYLFEHVAGRGGVEAGVGFILGGFRFAGT